MKRFLIAKHWQIFLIFMVIPYLFGVIFLPGIDETLLLHNNDALNGSFVNLIMSIGFMIGFFGWILSIVNGFKKAIPQNIKMRIWIFNIFIVILILYIIFYIAYNDNLFGISGQYGNILKISIFGFPIPHQLIAMCFMIYCLYYVARFYKIVELQSDIKWHDCFDVFFMILFYPIGIWIFQPKINNMIKNVRRHNII